jgi:hypothetical protein
VRGLLLIYGGEPDPTGGFLAGNGPYVSVAQGTDPSVRFVGFNFDVVNGQPAIAAGAVAVPEPGKAVISVNDGWWSVQFRQGALYVDIESRDRNLAIAAARNLVTVPA